MTSYKDKPTIEDMYNEGVIQKLIDNGNYVEIRSMLHKVRSLYLVYSVDLVNESDREILLLAMTMLSTHLGEELFPPSRDTPWWVCRCC